MKNNIHFSSLIITILVSCEDTLYAGNCKLTIKRHSTMHYLYKLTPEEYKKSIENSFKSPHVLSNMEYR